LPAVIPFLAKQFPSLSTREDATSSSSVATD
jgi:hypothetical protein